MTERIRCFSRRTSYILMAGTVLCACALFACGDEQGSTPPVEADSVADTGADADVGDVVDQDAAADAAADAIAEETSVFQLASALCEWVMSCCAVDELRAVLGLPDNAEGLRLAQELAVDFDGCGLHMEQWVLDRYRWVLSSVEIGRSLLDEDALAVCLDYFRDAADTCDVGRDWTLGQDTHPCSAVNLLQGLQAEGAPCMADFECDEGRLCDLLDGEPGSCRDRISTGSPCRSTAQCEIDAFCSANTVGLCAAPVVNPDGYCDTDASCSPDSFCSLSIHRCTPRFELDEPCEASNLCASRRCDPLTKRCVERAVTGDPCASNDMCQTGSYCDGTEDDLDLCEPLLFADLGDPCTGTGVACAEGLVCEAGVCAPGAAGTGGLCLTDAYCPVELFCRDNECTPRLAVNVDCVRSRQCRSHLWCGTSGACERRTSEGEECEGTAECEDGFWCDTETSECAAVAAVGEECTDVPCAADAVCRHYTGRCAVGAGDGEVCPVVTMCARDFYCKPPEQTLTVCRPVRIAGIGEDCRGAGVQCEESLFCNNYCQAGVQEGGYCHAGWCADGLTCFELMHQCVAQPALGEACYMGYLDCAEGQYCDGVCKELGEVDDPCSGDSQCVESLFCDPVAGECAAPKPVDEPCTLDLQCEEGLYCDTVAEKCVPPLPAEEPCYRDRQCEEATYCSGVTDACALRLEAGSPCSRERMCLEHDYCHGTTDECTEFADPGEGCTKDEECIEGTYCEADVCVVPPVAGEVCLTSRGCGDGSWCDPDSLVCTALLSLDEECTATAACEPEHYCATVAGRCAAVGGEGDPCSGPEACATDLECLQAGFCRDRTPEGEPCDPLSSRCVEDTICDVTARRCLRHETDKPIGASCVIAAECASLECVDGICVASCQGW